MSQEQVQVPKGWEVKDLVDVIQPLENGSRPKGGAKGITEGIPSLGGEHLNYNGGFNFGNLKFIPTKFFEKQQRGIIKLNDVLVVKDGATTGKTSFVDETFPYKQACVNEHVFIIRSKELLIPKYLFHYIRSTFSQKKISEKTRGTIGGINTTFVKDFPIIFPKNKEIQKKIVQKLDDILGQLGEKKKEILKLVDKNSENLETLTEQFQGELITKHFNSPQVLDNSEIKRLDEVCTINPSKQEIKDLDDKTQVSFIPMKLVDDKKGEITMTEIRNLGDVKGGYTYFKENDVIFAKITPCMQNGKCAIGLDLKNGIAFGSTEFHVFRVKEDVLPEWIYYFLRQYKLRKHAEKNMTGTAGQKRVPKEFLASYKIPIPPKSIQKDMIKKIKESSSHIHSDVKILNSIRDSHQNLLQQLYNSQSSILDTAFSGKLVK